VQPGDRVIIMSYVLMDEATARTHRPKIAVMDEKNRIVQMIGEEVHGTVIG
jgi:aspartate 1-decarboxylase